MASAYLLPSESNSAAFPFGYDLSKLSKEYANESHPSMETFDVTNWLCSQQPPGRTEQMLRVAERLRNCLHWSDPCRSFVDWFCQTTTKICCMDNATAASIQPIQGITPLAPCYDANHGRVLETFSRLKSLKVPKSLIPVLAGLDTGYRPGKSSDIIVRPKAKPDNLRRLMEGTIEQFTKSTEIHGCVLKSDMDELECCIIRMSQIASVRAKQANEREAVNKDLIDRLRMLSRETLAQLSDYNLEWIRQMLGGPAQDDDAEAEEEEEAEEAKAEEAEEADDDAEAEEEEEADDDAVAESDADDADDDAEEEASAKTFDTASEALEFFKYHGRGYIDYGGDGLSDIAKEDGSGRLL